MIIRWLCRALMHLFFSKITVVGADRFPTTGPVLVVSNHHSSLVDPAALLAALPRSPRFLAKAALWSLQYLPLRPFLAAAGTIPVHRHVDGGGDNGGMFVACHDSLADGAVIALFGEGVSHNMPGLLDLKTGAARIALGAETTTAVVPVGIVYDDRANYRSVVTIQVGEPIIVHGSNGGELDRDAVRSLTSAVADGLDAVAPTWSDWEMARVARVAARISVRASSENELGTTLATINRSIDQNEPAGLAVLDAVTDLEQECERLDLEVDTVVNQPRDHLGRLRIISLLLTALWTIPAIAGRVGNWPPFVAIGRLARTQDLNFQATAKILLGLALYPLWWVTVAVVVGALTTPLVGVAVLVVLPILGYLAASKLARLRRLQNHRRLRRGGHHEGDLLVRRDAVAEAVARLPSVE